MPTKTFGLKDVGTIGDVDVRNHQLPPEKSVADSGWRLVQLSKFSDNCRRWQTYNTPSAHNLAAIIAVGYKGELRAGRCSFPNGPQASLSRSPSWRCARFP